MKILFPDEIIFDINGVYNVQNDQIWAINRTEAEKNGGIQQKKNYTKNYGMVGSMFKGCFTISNFEKGTVDHALYINKVLLVALKYGNQMFGDDWVFQQDGATSHTHHLTQQWRKVNLPTFIDKDHWPPNSHV